MILRIISIGQCVSAPSICLDLATQQPLSLKERAIPQGVVPVFCYSFCPPVTWYFPMVYKGVFLLNKSQRHSILPCDLSGFSLPQSRELQHDISVTPLHQLTCALENVFRKPTCATCDRSGHKLRADSSRQRCADTRACIAYIACRQIGVLRARV